ncbi:hypothetical protein NA57DRAFT_59477 [Rhizodiscina lignyota]|uniref:Endonuclease/exonuclease/phosphatase domain-containing protein n=1 Tax=Rhizodiscina lignyota TaxID=1504668 RepID=A0A9P4IA24_9PEZI|nr:hypothetical protein NA57DRAFT_59477 [Rhizodiscina lignyota]
MSSNDDNPFSQEAIQKILNAPPPQRSEEPGFYNPRYQDYYAFQDGEWKKASTTAGTNSSSRTVRVLSWNIDMLIPYGIPRMAAALNYLDSLVSEAPTQPTIILLQEMTKTDLTQIQEAAWVRERFYITDVDNKHWISPFYGTTTLIDRRLNIKQVFRIPFISKFDRDGFFIDIRLAGSQDKVVRFCNAHLESLVADPPVRPVQLADAAPYLHDTSVHAGLLAGDCNAIQPFDRTLHSENNLKDAYLELGGKEDSDDGYTWGHQVKKWMREKFGPSRMDKVMYCGSMDAKSLKRIGIDVCVEDDGIREDMKRELEGDWVTDHYGLDAVMELTGAEVEISAHEQHHL